MIHCSIRSATVTLLLCLFFYLLQDRGASGGESGVEVVQSEVERSLEAEREAVRQEISFLRERRTEKEVVVRGGEWKSARFEGDTRSWQVQLERDIETGALGGRISVSGSLSMAAAAKVQGQMDGSAVSGIVTDEAGNQLATFSGVVTAEGMVGTYVTTDGDEGDWSHRDWQPQRTRLRSPE